MPTRADLRALPSTLREHLVPWRVAASAHLNPLQKLSYFGIVFVVAPIVILVGPRAVARDRRACTLAATDVRRAAVRAAVALCGHDRPHAVLCRAHPHGRADRVGQQPALHDQWMARGPGGSSTVKLKRRNFLGIIAGTSLSWLCATRDLAQRQPRLPQFSARRRSGWILRSSVRASRSRASTRLMMCRRTSEPMASIRRARIRYARWSKSGWRGYELRVDGLVDRAASYDLAALRQKFAMRSQITRHDCVEGWSVIGKWSGVRFSDLLADVRREAAGEVRCFSLHGHGHDGHVLLRVALRFASRSSASIACVRRSTTSRFQSRMARRCGSKCRRSSGTRARSTCSASNWWRRSAAVWAAAVIGKTRATNGTPASDAWHVGGDWKIAPKCSRANLFARGSKPASPRR